MEPLVSIQIVTYQSRRFLPYTLNSIKEQTYKNFSLLIVDNASTDGTVSYLKKDWPNVPVFQNKKNVGYSQGNNQAIKLTNSPYILVLNPDVILDKNFIEEAIRTISKQKQAGAVGGKLLKVKFQDKETGKFPKFTKVIDSCGLCLDKSLRFFDRGQGEEDKGQYDKQERVFGFCGAAVLYRRKALEDIKYKEEYFDRDFFAYKEDIDIAWRLNHKNWISFYNPKILGYHFRGTGAYSEKGKKFSLAAIEGQLAKSSKVNFLSWRNHLWLILKNCPFKLFLSQFPYFFPFQIGKTFWLLLQSPKAVIFGFFSFWQKFPDMVLKRKQILNK